MPTSTKTLLGVCLAIVLLAAPAWADPAPTLSGSARPPVSTIARPATPAPALDVSSFGFARAPRRAAPDRATIARPSPAPRVEGSICDDGSCSESACRASQTMETVVLRRTKPAFKRVAQAPAAETTRTVRTTKVIRIVQRSPRVITTCSPCVSTCDPCASRVEVCRDPCRPACEPRDPMCTPTVFWSSGYHDGRRASETCDPCDPCATTVCATPCESVCAPRRVRVVRCATPCFTPRRVCAPLCAPACGPVFRVGFGSPCGGFGWGGWGWGGGWRWGGCGGWW